MSERYTVFTYHDLPAFEVFFLNLAENLLSNLLLFSGISEDSASILGSNCYPQEHSKFYPLSGPGIQLAKSIEIEQNKPCAFRVVGSK